MRQASTASTSNGCFTYLAVLGIPAQVYVIVGLIDLLYQFWVHTRITRLSGMVPRHPSNHRVHHGQNDYCIDRNFGGIFCLWTGCSIGADEREEEPIVYGIRKHLLESGVE